MGKNQSTDHVNEEMDKIVKRVELLETMDIEQKLNVDKLTAYITNDSFVADPYALMGQFLVVRKTGDKCPDTLFGPGSQAAFSPFSIEYTAHENPSGRLKTPVQRNSIVVTKTMAAKVSFLNYLSGEMDMKETYSLIVLDQATGLINTGTDKWREAVVKWKKDNEEDIMDDPDVCYVFVVTGFVQKNVIRKTFKEFSAGAEAGAYGLNLNGKLYTSTEQYSLDIRFGLTPAIIKRPGPRPKQGEAIVDKPITDEEKKLFGTIAGEILKGKA